MPSKETPTANWHIRIDDHAGLREAFNKWVGGHVVTLAVWEAADDDSPNPHIHLAVRFNAPVTRQTVRNKIASLLPPTHARSDFATSQWDGGNTFLAYLSKGPSWRPIRDGTHKGEPLPPVVWSSMLLGVTVEELHAQFWTTNTQKGEAAKAATATKGNKKVTYREMSSLIAQRILDEKQIDLTSRDEWIGEATRQILLETKGYISDQVTFSVVQMILYLGLREMTEKMMARRMLNRFTGHYV